MTTENWQNVSANVIKIVGNSFLKTHGSNILDRLFDGNYVPGDVIGYGANVISNAYNKGYDTFGKNWGFAVGALNAGMQILGGLSAIYTLGSGSVGLEFKGADVHTGYVQA
uniref:hypothetical protein n=1 Tax=Faecalibacterium prausnitzii TaxID=853 RepID=UPI00402860C3